VVAAPVRDLLVPVPRVHRGLDPDPRYVGEELEHPQDVRLARRVGADQDGEWAQWELHPGQGA
jgi:hypothetical protein